MIIYSTCRGACSTVITTSLIRSILALLLGFHLSQGLHAQNLSILNVDTRNHPNFEAQIGYSGGESGLPTLRVADLQISHNGQPIQPVWSECSPPAVNATVIVVVGPDVHNVAGPESLNHLRNLLSAINAPFTLFTAIVQRGTRYEVLVTPKDNPSIVLDSLESYRQTVVPQVPRVHPFESDLETRRLLENTSGPRYLVMYGGGSDVTGWRGHYTKDWVRSLMSTVSIAGVILADAKPTSFAVLLASAYGGVACQEFMQTQADSLRTARRLAAFINGSCTVRWQAPVACPERDEVTVRHASTNQRDMLSVQRLGSDWTVVQPAPSFIRLAGRQRTPSVDTSFFVTSRISGDRIVSITCSDTGIRVQPQHDRIDEGVTCLITGMRTNRSAEVVRITVQTTHCATTVPIVFHWSPMPDASNVLRLITPSDSIALNSWILVRYAGVSDTTVVTVRVSLDKGLTWTEIGRGSGGSIRCKTPDVAEGPIVLNLSHAIVSTTTTIDSTTLASRAGVATVFDIDPTGKWVAVVDNGRLYLLDAVSLDTVHQTTIANAAFTPMTIYEAKFTADGASLYTSTVDGILRFDVASLRTTWIPTPHIMIRNMQFAMNKLMTHIGLVTQQTNSNIGGLTVAVLDSTGAIVSDTIMGLSCHTIHPTLPIWYVLTYARAILIHLDSSLPRFTNPAVSLVHSQVSVAGAHVNSQGTAIAVREAVGFSPVLHRFGGVSIRDAITLRTSTAIHIPATVREPLPDSHKIVGWTDDGSKVLTYGQFLRIHSGVPPEYYEECIHDENVNPTQTLHIVPGKSLVSLMKPSSLSPPYEVLHVMPQQGCEPRRHITDSAVATIFGEAQDLRWSSHGNDAYRLHTTSLVGVTRVSLDTVLDQVMHYDFSFYGTRRLPRLVLRPDTVVFPTTMVGHRFDTTLTNVLCNEGSAPALIASLNEQQSWGRAYRTAVQLPLRLDPGECITLPFHFIPSRIGALPGFMVFETDVSLDTLHFVGNSIASPIRIHNNRVHWPGIPVRKRSDTVIRNAIEVLSPFIVDSIRLTDDVSFFDDTPWSTVASTGGWLDLHLAFRAQGRWSHQSQVHLWHSGNSSPAIIHLSGHGLKGDLTFEIPPFVTATCMVPDTIETLIRCTGDDQVQIESVGLSQPLASSGVRWLATPRVVLRDGDAITTGLVFEPGAAGPPQRLWIAYTGIQGADTAWATLSTLLSAGLVEAYPPSIAAELPAMVQAIDTSFVVTHDLPTGAGLDVEVFGEGVSLLSTSFITPDQRSGTVTVPIRLTAADGGRVSGFVRVTSTACSTHVLVPVALMGANGEPRFDSITVSTEHYRVRAGQEFTVKLSVDVPASMRTLVPMPLTAGIRTNGTMMLPAVAKDRVLVEIEKERISLPIHDRMEFIGLLGTDSVAVIEPWVSIIPSIPVRIEPGSITILDLCNSSGGLRLFSGNAVSPIVRQLSSGVAEVSNAHTVSVFDMLGRRVFADTHIGEGIHHIDIPKAGLYVIVSTTRDGHVTTVLFGH
jgi:hypothetical protein